MSNSPERSPVNASVLPSGDSHASRTAHPVSLVAALLRPPGGRRCAIVRRRRLIADRQQTPVRREAVVVIAVGLGPVEIGVGADPPTAICLIKPS